MLSDYRIPTWGGVEAFRLLKKSGRDIPFILITGTLGEEAAVDLIKEGVADYILKDRLVRLPSAVRRALQEKTTDRKSTRLNSSHLVISYAVFCLKKKKDPPKRQDRRHRLLLRRPRSWPAQAERLAHVLDIARPASSYIVVS